MSGLGVGDRFALHGLGDHRRGRQLRHRRSRSAAAARAAALHGERFLENLRVGLIDRVPAQDVEGGRAVADALAVHGERSLVTGFLDHIAHLLVVLAERIRDGS